MTKKKAPVAAANGAGAKDEPDFTPSKLSKKAVQSLNRRIALHTAKYSSPVPASHASNAVRNLDARYALLVELLQHPAVREATMRQAVDFVRTNFPKEPVVARDVESVLRFRASLLSDPLEVPYGTEDARWRSALDQWTRSQSWALKRALLKVPELKFGPKGYLPGDDDDVAARNARWLYRSRVPRPDGSGKETIYSLAKEHRDRRRFWREGEPRPKVDTSPVRKGIEKTVKLLRLQHRKMS